MDYEMRRRGLKKMPRVFVRRPLPDTVSLIDVNGREIACVRFTDEMMNTAKELAAEIEEFDRKAGWKPVLSVQDLDSRLVGVMGEFAAAEYLFADWREAVGRIKAGPDAVDFVFRNKTFDVKTAGKDYHKELQAPVVQFEKHQSDFYIGAQRKREREIWLFGYVPNDEIAKAPQKDSGRGVAYCVSLRQLYPMSDLDPGTGKAWQPSLLRYMVNMIVSRESLSEMARMIVLSRSRSHSRAPSRRRRR
jgi:hypothetical protein